MPSGITMIPGKSGIGKTTVCIDILKTVKIHNPEKKLLFISVEMNKIHLYRYSKRLNFKDIPIFIFDVEQNISQQFSDILSEAWDLIFIDSFQQLVNLISVYDKISTRQAEVQIIKTMDHCRLGNNKQNINTASLCTMHMTKSNNFAGSAYIKYMVDAMLELHQDEDNEFLKYMVFAKNRDGKTDVRLYYSITEYGIEYNLSRYKESLDIQKGLKDVEQSKEESNRVFEITFNSDSFHHH
jgi:predicted ATP-dependent serine protease